MLSFRQHPTKRTRLLFRLIGLICFLLTVFMNTTSPAIASRNGWYVPVFFVSDRKPPKYWHDTWTGEDQLFDRQHVTFGTLWYPLTNVPQEHDANLRALGAKPFTGVDVALALLDLDDSLPKQHPLDAPLQTSPFAGLEYQSALNAFITGIAPHVRPHVMVFVHGCCISEMEALEAAAQLAVSTGLPVIAYDWATRGSLDSAPLPELNRYRKSERSLEISEVEFMRFMESLDVRGDTSYSIMGHSMGNRIVLRYLTERDQSVSRLKTVHLVRADLSLPAFLMQSKKYAVGVNQLIVYYANNDGWLKKSRALSSNSPRLGEPAEYVRLLKSDLPANLKFIDLTNRQGKHDIPYQLVSQEETQREMARGSGH
jgi:hypothetical protein